MESLLELPVLLWETTHEQPSAGSPLFLSSSLPCMGKPSDLRAVGNDTQIQLYTCQKHLLTDEKDSSVWGGFWGTVSGPVVTCWLLIQNRRKNKGNRWKLRSRGGDTIPFRALTRGRFGGEVRSSASLTQLHCVTYKHILATARWNPSCKSRIKLLPKL